MGKRSDGQFIRRKNDLYQTWDPRALPPLLRHLSPGTRYIEPCAGEGDLIRQLTAAGHICVGAFDIKPNVSMDIVKRDATKLRVEDEGCEADCFITNPAWTRRLLHAIMLNLHWQLPTWLLFDSDWWFTEQARPYQALVREIVPVGRLKWIRGSAHDAKDNVAWYRLGPPEPTIIWGRA